jgi:hypothetical protein
MGEFYTNVTLVGVVLDDVRSRLLAGGLAAQDGDCVVLYLDEDMLLGGGFAGVAARLNCPAVMASVHDGDILLLEIRQGSELLASGTVPDPSIVFGAEFGEIDSGQARAALQVLVPETLVSALGRGDVDAVREALGGDGYNDDKSNGDESDGDECGFKGAIDYHEALTVALGIARSAVGNGLNYLTHDPESFGGPQLFVL